MINFIWNCVSMTVFFVFTNIHVYWTETLLALHYWYYSLCHVIPGMVPWHIENIESWRKDCIHILSLYTCMPPGPKIGNKNYYWSILPVWLNFIVTIYYYICLEKHLVSLISSYRFKRKTELTENYDIVYTGQQPLVSSHMVPSPWFWWARRIV